MHWMKVSVFPCLQSITDGIPSDKKQWLAENIEACKPVKSECTSLRQAARPVLPISDGHVTTDVI